MPPVAGQYVHNDVERRAMVCAMRGCSLRCCRYIVESSALIGRTKNSCRNSGRFSFSKSMPQVASSREDFESRHATENTHLRGKSVAKSKSYCLCTCISQWTGQSRVPRWLVASCVCPLLISCFDDVSNLWPLVGPEHAPLCKFQPFGIWLLVPRLGMLYVYCLDESFLPLVRQAHLFSP
jgi:hypothetical protein